MPPSPFPMPPPTLWLVGLNAWPARVRAARFVDALRGHEVATVVDSRLNPSSSAPAHNGTHYGPKDWTLQVAGAGLDRLLASAGIEYRWLPELGNPQRLDRSMAILREHLADRSRDWPVHRGLQRLAGIVAEGRPVALLCSCSRYERCHRTVVARALADRHFGGQLRLGDVRSGLILGERT